MLPTFLRTKDLEKPEYCRRRTKLRDFSIFKTLIFFLMFVFEKERERERKGQRERGTEDPKQAPR